MTPAERNELCEKHRLDVVWFDSYAGWRVNMGSAPWDKLAESPHRDTAIDLAADRLAERGVL